MDRPERLPQHCALSCEEHFSTGCRSFGVFLHLFLLGCPLCDLPLPFTPPQDTRGSTGKKAAE